MKHIEIFLQGEGIKDIVLLKVPQDGIVQDIVNVAKADGHIYGDEASYIVYLEDAENILDTKATLSAAGISHRTHVHISRCLKVKVTVNFNGGSKTIDFPPPTTIRHVKKWATSKSVFDLTETDAGTHVLQICGSNTRPAEDIHIGALVTCPDCLICFDLAPVIRVEG